APRRDGPASPAAPTAPANTGAAWAAANGTSGLHAASGRAATAAGEMPAGIATGRPGIARPSAVTGIDDAVAIDSDGATISNVAGSAIWPAYACGPCACACADTYVPRVVIALRPGDM